MNPKGKLSNWLFGMLVIDAKVSCNGRMHVSGRACCLSIHISRKRHSSSCSFEDGLAIIPQEPKRRCRVISTIIIPAANDSQICWLHCVLMSGKGTLATSACPRPSKLPGIRRPVGHDSLIAISSSRTSSAQRKSLYLSRSNVGSNLGANGSSRCLRVGLSLRVIGLYGARQCLISTSVICSGGGSRKELGCCILRKDPAA